MCWLGRIGFSHFGQTESPFASRLTSRIDVTSGVGYFGTTTSYRHLDA
jgi:hypothetical protein